MRRISAAVAALFLAACAEAQPQTIRGPLQGMIAADVGGAFCALGGHHNDADFSAEFRCWQDGRGWFAYPPAPSPVSTAGALPIGEYLYVAGGLVGDFNCSGDLLAFSLSRHQWMPRRASMHTPRCDAAVAVADGRLYALGGTLENHSEVSAAEVFDPHKGAWSRLPPMPTARSGVTAGAIDGVVYAAGGLTGSRYRNELEAFDPATGIWTKKAPLPVARTNQAGGALDGKLYVVGGNAGGHCSSALFAYDPRVDRWERKAELPQPRCELAAAVVGNYLYVWGGLDGHGGYLNELLRYDPEVDAWLRPGEPAPPRRVAAVPAPAPQTQAPPPVEPTAPRRRGSPRPDDFALVIGIDDYRNVPHADFAARDAETFKDYAVQALGVPEENVTILTNDRATRTDFAKYVEEWLPKNVEKDSRVYVYFSGHGTADPKSASAYLLPWDGDAAFLESSAYPLKRLYAKLGELKAREAVVFLDSCFSGGGRSVMPKGTRPLVTVVDTAADRAAKVTVLTASAGDEFAGSLDRERHGLFTYYLLKGLDGAALDSKQTHLTIKRLHEYVRSSVVKAAHRENREQTPQLLSSDPRLKIF